jgi:hypothetical protein
MRKTKDTIRIPVKDSLATQTQKAVEVKYPQFQFKGIFQGRYTLGMTKDVDVNGLHHSDHSGTDNGFSLSI